MRKIICGLFLVMLATSLISCAYTTMAYQTNPEFSKQQYNNVLVAALFPDMEDSQTLELRVKSDLERLGLQCFTFHDIFFMGCSYSDEDIWLEIDERNIDAVLTFSIRGMGEQYLWRPPITITKTEGKIRRRGYISTATTSTFGGFYQTIPYGDFVVELVDVLNEECILIGTAHSTTGGLGTWEGALRSLGSKTVYVLRKCELLSESDNK